MLKTHERRSEISKTVPVTQEGLHSDVHVEGAGNNCSQ